MLYIQGIIPYSYLQPVEIVTFQMKLTAYTLDWCWLVLAGASWC